MTTQIAALGDAAFECSLLNRRFRQVLTISLEAATTEAAERSASAILQHEVAGQGNLVGFELRRDGLRVRTCLESLGTAASAFTVDADESPRRDCPAFDSVCE